MTDSSLNNFFEDFLTKESFFKDKGALTPSFLPSEVIHRSELVHKVANVLAPNLKLEKSSNLFLYGKTGTGKTLTVKNVTQNMCEVASQKNIPFRAIYVNCKLERVADTEYRLAAQLCKSIGREVPVTGLPTEQVYKIFFSAIEESTSSILLILDELDQLIKKTGDGVLYNLIRINEELRNSHISLVGISNDVFFVDNLDPRVKSSLSEEEIVFPPYNALQLRDILLDRVSAAFKPETFEEGVIEKCAAIAAREHGDARRALELVRVAGEIAERRGSSKIAVRHLDEASKKIEYDRLIDLVVYQPKHAQLTLYTIMSFEQDGPILTGEMYTLYQQFCAKANMQPLTQRRISDILAELDMLGLINARVLSKGRYGRTREINLAIPSASMQEVKEILTRELGFGK